MNTQISPISYIKIDKNVQQFELLQFFLNKVPFPVRKFINSNLNYENINKPAFIIKQKVGQPNNIEFDFVFSKFNPDRNNNNTRLSNTFFLKDEFERIDPNITKCKLYKSNDYVACYVKINEETVTSGSDSVKFLYMVHGNQKPLFPFYITDENLKGETKHTDMFTSLRDIVDPPNYHLYNINDIITDETMLFFASKPIDKTEAIIIEDLHFNNFLKFLTLCEYSNDFINFCKTNYDDSYSFCISYELNKSRKIVASSIYGILA